MFVDMGGYFNPLYWIPCEADNQHAAARKTANPATTVSQRGSDECKEKLLWYIIKHVETHVEPCLAGEQCPAAAAITSTTCDFNTQLIQSIQQTPTLLPFMWQSILMATQRGTPKHDCCFKKLTRFNIETLMHMLLDHIQSKCMQPQTEMEWKAVSNYRNNKERLWLLAPMVLIVRHWNEWNENTDMNSIESIFLKQRDQSELETAKGGSPGPTTIYKISEDLEMKIDQMLSLTDGTHTLSKGHDVSSFFSFADVRPLPVNMRSPTPIPQATTPIEPVSVISSAAQTQNNKTLNRLPTTIEDDRLDPLSMTLLTSGSISNNSQVGSLGTPTEDIHAAMTKNDPPTLEKQSLTDSTQKTSIFVNSETHIPDGGIHSASEVPENYTLCQDKVIRAPESTIATDNERIPEIMDAISAVTTPSGSENHRASPIRAITIDGILIDVEKDAVKGLATTLKTISMSNEHLSTSNAEGAVKNNSHSGDIVISVPGSDKSISHDVAGVVDDEPQNQLGSPQSPLSPDNSEVLSYNKSSSPKHLMLKSAILTIETSSAVRNESCSPVDLKGGSVSPPEVINGPWDESHVAASSALLQVKSSSSLKVALIDDAHVQKEHQSSANFVEEPSSLLPNQTPEDVSLFSDDGSSSEKMRENSVSPLERSGSLQKQDHSLKNTPVETFITPPSDMISHSSIGELESVVTVPAPKSIAAIANLDLLANGSAMIQEIGTQSSIINPPNENANIQDPNSTPETERPRTSDDTGQNSSAVSHAKPLISNSPTPSGTPPNEGSGKSPSSFDNGSRKSANLKRKNTELESLIPAKIPTRNGILHDCYFKPTTTVPVYGLLPAIHNGPKVDFSKLQEFYEQISPLNGIFYYIPHPHDGLTLARPISSILGVTYPESAVTELILDTFYPRTTLLNTVSDSQPSQIVEENCTV